MNRPFPSTWTEILLIFLEDVRVWRSAQDIAMRMDNVSCEKVRCKLSAWQHKGVLHKKRVKEGKFTRMYFRLNIKKGIHESN